MVFVVVGVRVCFGTAVELFFVSGPAGIAATLPVTEAKATELQRSVLNCILVVRAFNELPKNGE